MTLAAMTVAIALSQRSQIAVTINGDEINVGSTAPMIYKGRVLVPLRVVFESLGATVEWIPEKATAVVSKGDTIAKVFTGSPILEVNGEERYMDTEPQHLYGVMRVPLRAISEVIGAQVEWDRSTRTVKIMVAKDGDEPSWE